jgi:glycosyltransferase involved in cell wall biosynthesis
MSSPPLRVMFLTPYFRPYLGGIERAIEQLSFKLMESPSVEAVGVLTTKYAFPRVPHPEWADRDVTPEGISIFRLKGYPRYSIPLYSVPLVWFSPWQVKKYLAEFNPNVIHFVGDGWFWGHFWSWFWHRRRAEFVFTPSYHTLPLSRWWLRPINGFICNVMDSVVSLTQQEAQQVNRDYWALRKKQVVIGWGASPFKSSVVPGPAAKSPLTPLYERGEEDSSLYEGRKSDSGLYEKGEGGSLLVVTDGNEGDSEGQALPSPGRRGAGDEGLIILCVGRLGRHKGQEWLLKVYQQARSQFQRPATLVLVGRDEGGEAALRELAQTAGLQDEVIFTGELEDAELADWYSRADLLTLFSHYEAFGLVFFEALVCGVPVLTHDVGANRELLTKGAVVVPRFDEGAAVAALVRLVNETDYRQQLGREGQEYALKEFTWAAVAEKYLKIYQAAPGGGSR